MMNKIKNDLTFVTSLAVTFKHLIVQHQAGAPIYYFGHKMPFSKKTKKRGGKKKEGEKKTYFKKKGMFQPNVFNIRENKCTFHQKKGISKLKKVSFHPWKRPFFRKRTLS